MTTALNKVLERFNALNIPQKSAAVIRLGAYGDLMFATSVIAGLKQQGYHVLAFTSPPANEIISHDPNIDAHFTHQVGELTNVELGMFWAEIKPKFEKFVNLSESIEGTFLALEDRINFHWPYEVRKKHLDYNYLEFAHELAQVPHVPQIKFYPTDEEHAWARNRYLNMSNAGVVVWNIAGSAIHKVSPHIGLWVGFMLTEFPDHHIVLTGSPKDAFIVKAFGDHPNITYAAREGWTARQTYTFVQDWASLIVGTETGIMSAMSNEDMGKIVLLSHSTPNMLTRDWKNTIALSAPLAALSCGGCCHFRMNKNELWRELEGDKVHVTECQSKIPVNDIFDATLRLMRQ